MSGHSLSPLTEGAPEGRPDRVREVPAGAGRRPEGPGAAPAPRLRRVWLALADLHTHPRQPRGVAGSPRLVGSPGVGGTQATLPALTPPCAQPRGAGWGLGLRRPALVSQGAAREPGAPLALPCGPVAPGSVRTTAAASPRTSSARWPTSWRRSRSKCPPAGPPPRLGHARPAPG